MMYAILCYQSEAVTTAWSKEHDDEVIGKLGRVQDKLKADGVLGPVVRLMPTTAARTLKKDREPPVILDGPFAETKEQLLGFYVVECDSMDAAMDIARDLGRVNPGGSYEVRPIAVFKPNTPTAAA